MKIISAAYKDSQGVIHTGLNHGIAFCKSTDRWSWNADTRMGFITECDTFLTCKEASEITRQERLEKLGIDGDVTSEQLILLQEMGEGRSEWIENQNENVQ